jgi:LysM repeat protein
MKPEASYVAAYNKGVAGMKSAPKTTTPTKAPQQPTTVSPQPTPMQQVPTKAPVAAPTQAPAQAQAPAPTSTHEVVKGDTLGAIAKKYKTTVQDIQKLNPDIKDPNAIKPGQKIKTK